MFSNRGNNLLIKLLRNRYPYVFEERQIELLKQYLSVTSAAQGMNHFLFDVSVTILIFLDLFLQKYAVSENVCNSLLQTYISEYSKSYPMKIGEEFQDQEKNQVALFLVI